ncbi:hypothetical protein MSPP1_004030 [Malassezia sp. CBS 17886]|nr:hypothetical protein MSPP1_004030 [Malassezia sp. CBS 17886]
MNFLLKSITFLSAVAVVVLAKGDTEARCKCISRLGWTFSGDSLSVCKTLKDAHFLNDTQECVIPDSNWYGPGAFNSICEAHFGFTNCQMKDRQLQRRTIPAKEENLETRDKKSSSKGLADCQCVDSIFGHPEEDNTKESCGSIAGVNYDKGQQSCRISPSNDLQLEEFRRYCFLFGKSSSC